MKKTVLILCIIVLIGVGYYFLPKGEQICPDEWIINRMPGPPGGSGGEYFIIDGKRAEDTLDVAWVKRNCGLEPQEVF